VSFWVGVFLARSGDVETGVLALRSALRRNPRWRAILPRMPVAYRPPEAVLRRALRRHELRRLRPAPATPT
jgi:hypothetical protein